LRAFQYRIAQALDGRPHTGPLPAEVLRDVEALKPADKPAQGGTLEYYAVERMRQQHRILEPEQEVDAYQYWTANTSPLDRALAELANLADRKELAARVQGRRRDVNKPAGEPRSLRREGEDPPGPADVRASVLREALNQAPRVGEEFARDMLRQVTEA